MHELVTLYNSIPASTWQVLGAAIGLSGLLQALKHYFFSKLSPHAIMSLTTLFAFLGSAAQYAMQTVHQNPTVLGQHTAVLLGVMTVAYRYIISPGYNLLIDAKNYRNVVSPVPAATFDTPEQTTTSDAAASTTPSTTEASF